MYKYLLLISLLSIPISDAISTRIQDDVIQFSYDNAGNRIQKVIVMKTRVAQTQEEEQPSTLIDETFERQIIIYPNPTKGHLTIEISDMDNDKSGNLTIFNLKGQLIDKKQICSNIEYLDLSSEASGTYIFQIEIDGKISTWKIIKE